MGATIKDPQLLGSYIIEVDTNNFSLAKIKTVQSGKMKGKESREYIGHYSNLDGCLSRLVVNRMLDKDQVYKLAEFVSEFTEAFNKTQKALHDKYPEELRLFSQSVRSKEID